MSPNYENRPVDLHRIRITDAFWKTEEELVRKEVIPYQWEALNDRVPGAAPSYAMHNFRAAAHLREREDEPGFVPPVFHEKNFEVLPEDPAHPDPDQDSDFYKWVEAVSYSLISHPDPELQKTAEEAIDLLCRAQAKDGYLDTYYILNGRDKSFTNLRDNHELYCFGHLTEAAVAFFQATGSRKLLECAERYAAYIDAHIGAEEGKKHGYPGHEIAEMALVRLYEASGDEKYLKLSRYFIDERGKEPNYFDLEGHEAHDYQDGTEHNSYYQAHKPVREQEEIKGHAVRAMYLCSGIADIARITGDESLKETARRLFKSTVRDKMYITGGIGSTHIGEAFTFPFDLPNDTVYAESCASIGLCFFARRMLEMEPRSIYADAMERALYNTVLSGIALDGKSFFYVNPLEVHPVSDRLDQRKRHVKTVRQKWFGCACCPPNIARILSSLGSYAFTENEDTLFTHLFIGAEIRKEVRGKEVNINLTVDRGEEDVRTLRFRIEARETPFTLAVRIPDWCDNPEFSVPESMREIRDGYCYIRKEWQDTDELTVRFPFRARFMKADSRVSEDAGKAALMYGPFVYCLEEKDNGPDLHLLSIPSGIKASDVRKEKTVIGGREATVLLVPGFREKPASDLGLYYDMETHPAENVPVTLRLIPYFMWANRGENEMQVFTRLS